VESLICAEQIDFMHLRGKEKTDELRQKEIPHLGMRVCDIVRFGGQRCANLKRILKLQPSTLLRNLRAPLHTLIFLYFCLFAYLRD